MWNKIQKIYMHTSNVRLPAEYQEVEYIQWTWSWWTSWTYIDTWFKPNNNTRYVVEYEKADSRQAPIWCWNNPANYGLIIIDQYVHYATEIQYTSWLNAINTKLLADLNKNNFYLDEVLKNTFTADTFQMNINAWLFCWNRNGEQSNNYWNIKIWSAKIYDDWTLVRDFVPCYRKQDSVIWMYDIVNNVFYTNAGSWAFTKWADIPNTTEHLVRPAS